MAAGASYADLNCSIAAVVGADLLASVAANEASPLDSELAMTFTSDATPAEAAAPQTTEPQRVSLWVKVDDGPLMPSDMIGGVSVTRSYDQRLQTWRFSVGLRTPLGPFGSPFNHAGPALCKKRIDFFGVYKTSTGEHLIPLLRGGIADSSARHGSLSGATEDFAGVDRGGRFDQKVATEVLPPGHGLSRGSVVNRLARSAGETQTSLEGGGKMLKEVQVVDGDWLSIASEISEVENRRILWNRQGYLTNPKVGRPRPGEAMHFNFVETDLLAVDEVQSQHKADILTDVTLSGTQQVPRDEDSCGDETTPTEVETIASSYALVAPLYIQTTGGAYNANPQPSAQSNVRTRLVLHEQTTRCGTLIWERTTTWALINPESGRFKWDAVNHEWDPLSCYTDAGEANDEPAYQFFREQWRKIEISETWYYYNRERFRRSDLVDPNVYAPLHALNGVVGTGAEESGAQLGFYLGSVTRTSSIGAPRKRVKERDISGGYPYDAWDTLEPVDNVLVLGDKSAWDTNPTLPWTVGGLDVAGQIAYGTALIANSEVVECQFANDAGFVQRVLKTTYSWGARKGSSFLYGDGSVYGDDVESWRQTGTEETIYIPTTENAHTAIISRTGLDGVPLGSEIQRGQQGAGPAIAKMEVQETSSANYDSTSEQTDAQTNARRSDTKAIKVQVIAAGLEECHEKGILKAEVAWAESEAELEEMAKAMIEDSAAAVVTFTLPANFFIGEAQCGHVRYVPIDLDHDCRVRTVTWDKQVGSPLVTRVEALVYGW